MKFVLANLNTAEGHRFATRHGVPNTTLVFFDAKGDRIAILHGRQEEAVLREEIRSILEL